MTHLDSILLHDDSDEGPESVVLVDKFPSCNVDTAGNVFQRVKAPLHAILVVFCFSLEI